MVPLIPLCGLLLASPFPVGQTTLSPPPAGVVLGKPISALRKPAPAPAPAPAGPIVTIGRPVLVGSSQDPEPVRRPVAPAPSLVTLGRPVAVTRTGTPVVHRGVAPDREENRTEAIQLVAASKSEPRPPAAPVSSGDPFFPEDRANPAPPKTSGRWWASSAPGGACPPKTCFWVEGEFLLWYLKQGPLPVPVATVGDPTNTFPGALGQPGTVVVSGDSIDYGNLPGFRATVGGWFDPEHVFGAEVSGFLLEQGSDRSSFASSPNGTTTLSIPVFRPDLGREGVIPLAFPGLFAGSLNVSSTSRLWGLEANALWGVWKDGNWKVDLLGGLRYIDLSENLTLDGVSTSLITTNTLVFSDGFSTRNQFYGGQVGARSKVQFGAFDLLVQGKLAFGATHQVVSINGTSTSTTGGTTQTGALAVASNIGRQTRTDFGFVPHVGLQLGWNLGAHTRLFAGTDFLYWSNVVRPGDQIDRNVNINTASTPPAPQPRFQTTDFWATGVSVGVTFQY